MNDPKHIIIAIDGPAGAGKSTVASRLAKRFHLLNLETGAMYRAFALKALEHGISLDDAVALEALAASTSIRLEPSGSGNRVYLDGVEVTSRLREPQITEAASRVSVHPQIRTWMVDLQRSLGAEGGIVMEGRDIGSAVFPDAGVKIFLDADPEVRSQRRYEQTGGLPTATAVAPESVLKEIRERDQRDRTRAVSPLRPAPDALVIDSTSLSLDEVVAQVEAIVEEKLGLQKPR